MQYSTTFRLPLNSFGYLPRELEKKHQSTNECLVSKYSKSLVLHKNIIFWPPSQFFWVLPPVVEK